MDAKKGGLGLVKSRRFGPFSLRSFSARSMTMCSKPRCL